MMCHQLYRSRRYRCPRVIAFLCVLLWGTAQAQPSRAISPEKEVQGKHVRLLLGVTPQAALPGGRITLSIEVVLQPGLHVYAPGVTDYIPIAWTMKPSAGAAVQPVTFPPSRKLHLPAIDETVPAYEGRIHLIRAVQVGKNAKGNLTLEGSLRYQACDDRLCYIPETLPVKWVVHLESK